MADLWKCTPAPSRRPRGQRTLACFQQGLRVWHAGYDAAEAGDMFDRIDLDHGGTVSLDEFAAWWLSDSHKAAETGGPIS